MALSEQEEFELLSLEREKAHGGVPATKPERDFGGRLMDIATAGGKGLLTGGPLGLVSGAGGEGLKQAGHALDRVAYNAGGKITDLAAPHVSPEVAAGLGAATNVGVQALPMLVGGEAAKAASPAFQAGAKRLMSSALKPTLENLRKGNAARAIDTMLEQGLNATAGGVAQMRAKIGELNRQISEAIVASPATVDKGKVAGQLFGTLKKFENQVNPQADIKIIEKAWDDFVNHPLLTSNDIPVQVAQTMKQGTYKVLGDKAYGELKGAEMEAQKALARGLKEGVAEAVPGVAGMNKAESELINALGVAERRALMDMNKNPAGLSLLAKNPQAAVAFMADKSALFKSLLARMINAGSEQIPSTAGKAVGAAAGAYTGRKE